MQPRAFGDIYCFPVPVAIGTDENLLQAKLAETSLLFSKFCNRSTNTFEINIKKMSFTVLNFRNKRLSGNTFMETNAYSASYFNLGGVEFCLRLAIIISLLREILHLAFPISINLVLNLNVRKVFAMPSLFPHI